MVPEHAGRKGNTLHTCRATEVVVLDIYDTNGLPVEEAVSIYDEEVIYKKGETVFPQEADKEQSGDWDGIYFVLSREETSFFGEN